MRFQLTPSRRATHAFSQRFSSKSISTHALTEGDDSAGIRRSSWYISTHALTEGDVFSSVKSMHAFNFNSRPHGGRHHRSGHDYDRVEFQLTPSRRATHSCCRYSSFLSHFNSRPHGGRRTSRKHSSPAENFNSRPHGGRPLDCRNLWPSLCISTHALTEGDSDCVSFLHGQADISTHALTEGDLDARRSLSASSHFNSRPHGGRPSMLLALSFLRYFNSRPHGGRRGKGLFMAYAKVISTHALTEGDGKFRQIFLLNRGYAYSISLYFLPHFISLLPQILSFQQKSFKFQVRIFLLFSVHLAFALQNQCVHHVKSRFCTNMFYFVFVLFTQIVKSQTISLFIYDFF